jgi:hypothetical protein
VEENQMVGVFVLGSDAEVEATVVRSNRPDATGRGGWGITVQHDPQTGERGKLVLASSLAEENQMVGVFVWGSDAEVEATTVRSTRPDARGMFGRGIDVTFNPETGERGKLVLVSSLVEENHEVGLAVMGSDAEVEATAVRSTQPTAAGTGGRGINVQGHTGTGDRGKLVLVSSLVEENHDIGLFVRGSDAQVEASMVRSTQPNATGTAGMGISVQFDLETGDRGKLVLVSSVVEQNHEVGVAVLGSDAEVGATVVRATSASPADFDFGDGVLVADVGNPASARLIATEATDNARCGVMSLGSTGELSSVRSTGNRFGLVLQPGLSGAEPTLIEGNVFEGNAEQNQVRGGDLAVPSVPLPLP